MSDEKFKTLAKSACCLALAGMVTIVVGSLDLSKFSLSALGGLLTGEK